ncbi:MAG: Crp/Fnr family transcriptional regulator [Bryobacteraceae bacterium]
MWPTSVRLAAPFAPRAPKELEDLLAQLPCSSIVAHAKNDVIYNSQKPATSLYLIIAGRVKLSRIASAGGRVLIDIYHAEEFFGESCLLEPDCHGTEAVALEESKIMVWPATELGELISTRGRLGIALSQALAQREMELSRRILSFSAERIDCRLARSIIRFSEHLGTAEDGGAVRMMAMSHALLAEYVGTSREIVTHFMNQFRQQGYLLYSRKGIVVYPAPFKQWLIGSKRQD